MEGQSNVSGNIFDYQLLKRVIKLAAPYRLKFILATVMAVVIAVLSPVRPLIVQFTVDNYIAYANMDGLVRMSMLMVGVLLVETFIRYHFIYLTRWLGQSVIKNLRVRVFKHVVNMRLNYFDTTPIGTSTTRTINDVETINDIFSEGLITIIADVLTLVAVIAFMFFMDWRLALVSLITLPFLLYATYLFKEGVKSAFQKVRTQVSRMNAFLQEHISGVRIIQIFSSEKREFDKFQKINDDQKQAHIQAIWYYSVFFPAVEIILAVAIGLLVWIGSNMVIKNSLEVGVIIAFIMYLNMLFRPLRMLADKFNTLQMGLVASERVFRLLDRAEHITDTGTKPLETVTGRIDFDHVWFAYNEKEWVLKDIDFSVQPGETLAIVGATGAGKTSIINLLSRFYDIQKGEIKLDGTDIREYPLDDLRSHISVVLQDVFLFSGSILDNIRLRDESIQREKVNEAARMIGAEQFIERMPGGFDYKVMERGATLSMGQRQLISFIRSMVFDPSILILDEATSSIDSESEEIIQQAIEKLVKDRTSIVIAHRLSTIQNADKILVLDKGQLVEAGTHEELLAKGGHYAGLHEMQFGAAG
jgi:ATP-binding cassette subfamily B protein